MSWEEAKLKDITEVMHQGVNTSADEVKYYDSGYQIIQSRNFTGGKLDLKGSKFVSKIDFEKYRYKYAPQSNDILLSNIGTIGKSIIVNEQTDFLIAWNVFLLRPKSSLIYPKYYRAFLERLNFINFYDRYLTGGTVKFVNKTNLGSIQIPLPPLEEQKRIVELLDQAQALIDKRKEQLALMDDLIQSLFYEMFGDPVTNSMGWEEISLDHVAKIRSGVTKGRKFNGKETVYTPYMRVANVQDGFIDLSNVTEIEVLPSDVEKYHLKKNDLLLTEGGDPDKLGRGAIWHGEIENCIHQNHIFCVRLKLNLLLPEYASKLIGSARCKRYFLKSAKQTTGIATINSTQLKKCPMLLPPLTLQKQFVEQVQKIETQKAAMAASLKELEGNFGSIMQRAFKGGL